MPTHSREELTWLKTSVTAATNNKAAIRIETASNRGTANPVAAAWSLPRAAGGLAETKTRSSRNRLASTRGRRALAAGRACIREPARKSPCKVCKRRARSSTVIVSGTTRNVAKNSGAPRRDHTTHQPSACVAWSLLSSLLQGPLKSIPVLNQVSRPTNRDEGGHADLRHRVRHR